MPVHKSVALVGAAALMLTAGGCESENRAGAANRGPVDVATIKNSIQADQDKWNEEYHAKPKSGDRLWAHYAPDAFIVPSGLDPVAGKWNIKTLMDTLARDPNFDMRFAGDRIEVSSSGDLAYVRGRF
jgi:ketosteroid isomerase-like protein